MSKPKTEYVEFPDLDGKRTIIMPADLFKEVTKALHEGTWNDLEMPKSVKKYGKAKK